VNSSAHASSPFAACTHGSSESRVTAIGPAATLPAVSSGGPAPEGHAKYHRHHLSLQSPGVLRFCQIYLNAPSESLTRLCRVSIVFDMGPSQAPPPNGLEKHNGRAVRWGSVGASTKPNGFAFSWRLGPTGSPLGNRWAPLGNLVKADDRPLARHVRNPTATVDVTRLAGRFCRGCPLSAPRLGSVERIFFCFFSPRLVPALAECCKPTHVLPRPAPRGPHPTLAPRAGGCAVWRRPRPCPARGSTVARP